MSAREDQVRREIAIEARIETGKERLRIAQLVLVAFTQGKSIAETAASIAMPSGKRMCRATAWRYRVWLGVQSGKQWKTAGERTGRRNTRGAIEELTR